MSDAKPTFTACHNCNRGGNGNATDKCACGWQVRKPSALGCYIGTEIVGEIKQAPKVSRSKERYHQFLDSDLDIPFGEWLKWRMYEPQGVAI